MAAHTASRPEKKVYDQAFFEEQQDGSLRSAREVVPIILSLIHPQSVVDVGCGIGTWLAAFREHQIEDLLGVDGNYINESMLLIPREQFLSHDLTSRFDPKRKFDLALSVEVAEHLPERSAGDLIDQLTSMSDAVVFSAAIPGQGGIQHVNEQWPDYWVELFRERGYVLVDCLRSRIWDNENIAPHYRQNLLLFSNPGYLINRPALNEEGQKNRNFPLRVVHPGVFKEVSSRPLTLLPLIHALPGAIAMAIRKRISILR